MAVVGLALSSGCALVADEYERHVSPDGERTLIIRQYADWIDPMYPLQLQHGWSTIDLGCVNGDYLGIDSVTWVDNATLQINISRSDADFPVVIRFDEEPITTGDPEDLLHTC